MTMYRLLHNLSYKGEILTRGSITSLSLQPEKIAKLIEVGAIAEVSSPPLSVLPGWEVRAAKLERAGVIKVEDLLTADAFELAKKLRIKVATIEEWRDSVVKWMTAKPPEG